jgi:electron transport complex protein RnfC
VSHMFIRRSVSGEPHTAGTFARGIHPPDEKRFSAESPIEVMPAPAEVVIPLLMHTGAPCEPLVKPHQTVTVGDVIGAAAAFVSAPAHASIDGTVQALSVTTLPNGRHVRTVVIQAAAAGQPPSAVQPGTPEGGRAAPLWADLFGGEWPVEDLAGGTHKPPMGAEKNTPVGGCATSSEIIEAVRAAGVVGLGGAAFPTHVKLTPNPAKPVDTLLVNGCECEPYLTGDHRLMIEAPGAIVAGALLAGRAAGAERIVVAVEDNKPAAAAAVERAAAGAGLRVSVVATKYPMGGERQVVPAVLRRRVPTGGLPLDVGVVVLNVGTAAAIAAAVLRRRPLTHRIITVAGGGVRRPANLFVPIGVRFAAVIEHCGGLTDDAAVVVAGGPMMGFAVGTLDVPVTKGTSGITVLTRDDVRRAARTACIRCGRCVDVCPLHLVPTRLALAAQAADWDLARRYHLTACCECGCCAYVCPARIPLVQIIRAGKAQMPRE